MSRLTATARVLRHPPGQKRRIFSRRNTALRVGVVIDENLMRHETVNCHPLVNTATTNIARDDLLRFIRASGHEPRILRLDAPDGS